MDSLNSEHPPVPPETLKHMIDIYSLYCDLRTHFSQYGFFFKGSSISFATDVMQHLNLASDSTNDGDGIDDTIADTTTTRVSGACVMSPAEKHANIDF